jgi:hypothetical protein
VAPPPYDRPRWDGAPLAGRTILLHAEMGLGDTLQFVRYADAVRRRGGRVILACQRPLARLLDGCPGVDLLVPQDAPPPPFDVYAPLMSLPGLLGTTADAIPAPVPYLAADPDLVARWRGAVAGDDALKVGVAWQGNPQHPKDRERSFPLAALAAVAAVPGVRLYSLQKGPGAEQLADPHLPFTVHDLGGRLDEEAGPFRDTAAVLTLLDLVIAADSALAHLAGALAVPAWVALPMAADWRWMVARDDTPWYPTLRLFRQAAWGDWGGVFDRMAAALRERAGQAGASGS